jgi:hypothetical protein
MAGKAARPTVPATCLAAPALLPAAARGGRTRLLPLPAAALVPGPPPGQPLIRSGPPHLALVAAHVGQVVRALAALLQGRGGALLALGPRAWGEWGRQAGSGARAMRARSRARA